MPPASSQQPARLIVMLSEVWTMIEPRELAGLVKVGAIAEHAGADGVLIGEHIVLAADSARLGVPANPREWLGAWATDGGQRRLELNSHDGRECLGGGFDAGDAVDAVAAELLSVVDHEQHDVAFAGASE